MKATTLPFVYNLKRSPRHVSRGSFHRDFRLAFSSAVLTALGVVSLFPTSFVTYPEITPTYSTDLNLVSVENARDLGEVEFVPRRKLQADVEAQDNSTIGEANIAYFIQMSDSTAGHLHRLIHRIYHPKNIFAVHFDMKMASERVQKLKKSIFDESPHFERNVYFMERELITYRGVSMLLNTINAMEFLLERNEHWDYFINISGSDYPLISPEHQRRLLGRHVNNAFNFVTFCPKEKWPSNVEYRMNHFYVDEALSFGEGASEVTQTSQQNPLAKMMKFEYANAEAWMINSRDFCKFVVTSGYARKMLLTFGYSVESSEHYFSSLLWNHPRYNRTVVSRAMRHVIWYHEGRSAGQHPFFVDEKASDGGFVFKDEVLASPNFFIRKFKTSNSPLMDLIDSRVTNPDHMQVVENHFSWAVNAALGEHEAKPRISSEHLD